MEILKKFTGDSGFKAEIQQLDEYVFSTDAYILIRTKGTLQNPPKEVASDKAKDYINNLLKEDVIGEITIDCKEVISRLDIFKTVPKYNEQHESCNDCNGVGSVTWEFNDYEKEDDCPVCDGDGSIVTKSKYLGKGFEPFYSVRVFDDVFLRLDLLYRIISIANNITLKNTKMNHVFFEFGNYDGLVMKYMAEYNESVKLDLTKELVLVK